MKRLGKIIVGIVIMLSIASAISCGGVGTPSISIPTPVTGRITVSSPDDSGNISVLGEAGAVSASVTVMAINSSVASLDIIPKILGFFVKNAYAGSFPAVCSQTGRACALADAEGAFAISIPGSAGDSIVIVVINATTGVEISDRLTREAPTDLSAFSYSVAGVAMNPYNVSEVYVLLDGVADTIDNQIVVYTPSTNARDAITVANGHDGVDILADSSNVMVGNVDSAGGELFVAALDASGGFTAAGFEQMTLFEKTGLTYTDYISGSFLASNHSFSSIYTPNETTTNSYSVARLSNIWAVTESPVSSGLISGDHVGTNAVANGVGPTSAGAAQKLLAILARYGTGTYLIVLDEAAIYQWTSGGLQPPPSPVAVALLPAGAEGVDVEFVDSLGKIIVTDKGNDAIYIYTMSTNTESGFATEKVTITNAAIVNPLETLVSGNYAFVTANDGDATKQDSVLTIDLANNEYLKLNAVGLLPTGLAYDSTNEILYIGCYTSKSVKSLTLTELLP